MEIYNDDKNYSHPNINYLTSENLTCTFFIKINKNITNNYKLINKNDDFLLILSKDRKISFYKEKVKKFETKQLKLNQKYHITFIHSINSGKYYLYIDAEIENIYESHNCSKHLDGEIKFLYGNDEYQLSKIKMYNYLFSLKQVKLYYLYDTKDKIGMLKFMSNHIDEIMHFNNGIISGFISEDIFVLFTKQTIFSSQKNYPFDTYIKYNTELVEHKMPQILTFMNIKTRDIEEKFDVKEMIANLITWQYGLYQRNYPKNINKSITGYWVENELSFYSPFIGKGNTNVSENGEMIENIGTFQNGMHISFLKLIIDDYLITNKNYSFVSIDKFCDYIITIYDEYNGGVPLYYPKSKNEKWKNNISIKNGNFINYIRCIETLLKNEDVLISKHKEIKQKFSLLKEIYKKSLNLILKLQINVGDKLTIWGQYYDKNTYDPVEGNSNEPIGLCSLESAQILLYLMEFENPTKNIINSIIAGCKWFEEYKIKNWIQIFDKKKYNYDDSDLNINQTLLEKYKYDAFSDKMYLHARYYDFDSEEPFFLENNNVYTLETFNEMSVEFRNSEYLIGMWGHNLLERYEDWKIINFID